MATPLPIPSLVKRDALVTLERTQAAQGAVHSRKVEQASGTLYTLSFLNRRFAARHAIQEHYYENFRAPFEWTPPRESTAVRVMYVGSPQAQRVGHRWAITLALETTP